MHNDTIIIVQTLFFPPFSGRYITWNVSNVANPFPFASSIENGGRSLVCSFFVTLFYLCFMCFGNIAMLVLRREIFLFCGAVRCGAAGKDFTSSTLQKPVAVLRCDSPDNHATLQSPHFGSSSSPLYRMLWHGMSWHSRIPCANGREPPPTSSGCRSCHGCRWRDFSPPVSSNGPTGRSGLCMTCRIRCDFRAAFSCCSVCSVIAAPPSSFFVWCGFFLLPLQGVFLLPGQRILSSASRHEI